MQDIEEVVHDTGGTQPGGKDDLEIIILDVGKEEVDGVDLGDASLEEGGVGVLVRVKSSLEGGMGQSDAIETGSVLGDGSNGEVGDIKLEAVSTVCPSHCRKEEKKRTDRHGETLLELDVDGVLLGPRA